MKISLEQIADEDGRFTHEAFKFVYDGLGRIKSSFDNNDPNDNSDDVTCAYEYDTLSRVTKETQTIGSVTHDVVKGYDSLTKRDVIYPSGKKISCSYDNIYRLTNINVDSALVAEYTYNGNRVNTKTFGNETKLSIGYDANRWIRSYTTRESSNNLIAGFEYGYDKIGNRLYEKYLHETHKDAGNAGNGDVYKYDSIYRLTDVK